MGKIVLFTGGHGLEFVTLTIDDHLRLQSFKMKLTTMLVEQ